MPKKTFASLLILFAGIITISFGQNTESQLLGASSQHKVMIIPFTSYNYFSDADVELANHNKKQPADISTLFRYGLNYNLSARVIAAGTYNILTDSTIDSQKDLQMIYANLQYNFEKPMDAFAADSAESKTITQKDLFGNGGEEQVEEKEEKQKFFQKQEVVEESRLSKYMNATLKNPEIFSTLQEKYNTDLFLFINQFELITNYNHCLDRTANYFERKVIVHYSLYNAQGKQLKGDAVTVTFSSGQTNVDDIIGKNFPVIAEYLNQSISTGITPAQKTR